MNLTLRFLTWIFSRLLHLYPGSFRKEFSGEMQVVFVDAVNEAIQDGILSFLSVGMRELGGLMISVLREVWYEFERKGAKMDSKQDKNLETRIKTPAGTRDALLATIPFALFGLVCMLIELELPISPNYAYLSFSILISLGIVIGLAINFPLWTYGYLAWAIAMALLWSGSWLFLVIAISIGLLLARSFRPLRQMIRGVQEDWTLLSFMMYSFVAFTMLIYDENHHPYLAIFMIGSTITISLGAWFYLRSTGTWKKLISLFFGFVIAYTISYICYASWDWAAYHGFPERPPEAWYVVLRNTIEILLIWSVVLFWPAIIGLTQRLFHKNRIA